MLDDTLRIFADTAYCAPDTLSTYSNRIGAVLRALREVHPRFTDLALFADKSGELEVPRDHSGLQSLIAAVLAEKGQLDDYLDTGPDGSLLPESRDRIGFMVTFAGRTHEPSQEGLRQGFSLRFHGNPSGHHASRTAFEFPISAQCEWRDPQLVRAIVRVLIEHWRASYVAVGRLAFQRVLRREAGNKAVFDWMTYFSRKSLVACMPSDIRREAFGQGELLVATEQLPDPTSAGDLDAARRMRAALADFGLADEPFHALNGWRLDSEEQRYELAISGAPPDRKYSVNCVDFDGYDPQRKVLLYAKLFRDLRVTPKAWGLRGIDAPVLNEARRQVRAAAKAGGVLIEWHIGLEEPARRAAELLSEYGGIPTSQIQVRYTPFETVVPPNQPLAGRA